MDRHNKTVLLTIITSLFLVSLSLSQVRAKDNIGIVIAEKGLNLRDAPSLSGKVRTVLPCGTRLEVLEIQQTVAVVSGNHGYWTRISYAGSSGWIFNTRGFFTVTGLYEHKLYVVREAGLEMRNGPSEKAGILKHLEYGFQVMTITENFQDSEGRLWVYAKAGNETGYVPDMYLTTVHYKIDQIKEGPFAGMTFTALPESFTDGPCSSMNQPFCDPVEKDYSIGWLYHNKISYLVLYKQTGLYGNHAEHRIMQIIVKSDSVNEDYVFCSRFDIRCSDSNGKVYPLAKVDFSDAKIIKKEDDAVIYKGAIKTAWIFDDSAGLLKEVVVPGDALCTSYSNCCE